MGLLIRKYSAISNQASTLVACTLAQCTAPDVYCKDERPDDN